MNIRKSSLGARENSVAVNAPSDVQDSNHLNGISGISGIENGVSSGMGTMPGSLNGNPMGYSAAMGQENVDLRQVFTILRRRRKIMAATVILVVALGTVLTFLAKPIYQATATLLVDTSTAGSSSSSSDSMPVLADLLDATKARSQETQIEVVKSTPIKKGALVRIPEAQRQAIKTYSVVDIVPVRDTDVIAVNVTSRDPKAAQTYSQAICDEYINSVQQQNQQQVLTATRYVSSQLPGVRQELYEARQKLRRFKESNGTIDITAETQGRVAQLAQAESDLRQAQTEQQENNAQLQQMRNMAAKLSPTQVSESTVVHRPVVEDLKSQLTKLELSRMEAMQEYQPSSPQVQTLQGQIDDIKKRLTTEATTEIGTSSNAPNPIRMQVMGDAAKAQSQVWAKESRVHALTTTVAQVRAQLQKLPGKEAQLGQLTTDVATLQATYQMLNEKYQNLRVSEEAKVSPARIVSPSDFPEVPISPNKPRNILLSFVLGCLLAAAMASVAERLDDRVHSESDAEIASGLPVLAVIPFIRDKEKQSLIGDIHQNPMLLESYRMLRTSIEFASIDTRIRSLVVTSSQPNEGKSTTSADLAIVMALDGKRVVLVDADLRRPSIHRLMKLENKIGFTNVVMGTATLEAALQPSSVPGLSILTSGSIPPNPPELLNSHAAHNVLRQLLEIADFVIIDTPPALVMADAQIAASGADATLLVISVQEAGRREIARTSHLLSHTGTKVLGCVLNKLTREESSYYGYYNYNSNNKYYGSYLEKEQAEPSTL